MRISRKRAASMLDVDPNTISKWFKEAGVAASRVRPEKGFFGDRRLEYSYDVREVIAFVRRAHPELLPKIREFLAVVVENRAANLTR
jgi:hypothetical protein